MASQVISKGLPPPPLRIDKRRHEASSTQPNAHASISSSGLSGGATEVVRSNSGRFRIRKVSLSRQKEASEAGPSINTATTSYVNGSQATSNAWQPRWAPKLKRTNPSESVTTYSPILSPPLPPLPWGVASPPPAVQLDDAGFGRPFSTTGLLDLDPTRFSFLDMGSRDPDSDSDSEGTTLATHATQHLPTIREPSSEKETDGEALSTRASSALGGPADTITSSGVFGDRSRDTLRLPLSTSPLASEDSRSRQNSLPGTSPALGSLISSFPNPLLLSDVHNDTSVARPDLHTQNSWDGGERWVVETGARPGHNSTELPYLDMDEDETEVLEEEMGTPELMQHGADSSSISPPRTRIIRNPPPLPAPTMALPDLPPKPSVVAPTGPRQDTPTGSSQQHDELQEGEITSAVVAKQVQRPLILPSLRSSSSIDRLAAMQTGSASSSPPHADDHAHTKPLVLRPLALQRTASTDEIAKSLDIPRDTVDQMFETTQHVWRNHLLGSSVLPSNDSDSPKRISKSSSSPMLSTLFASQGVSDKAASRDDLSKVGTANANKSSNRTSTLGLPYISSTRPSFEQQSPGWAMTKGGNETRSQMERLKHRRTFLGRSSEDGATASYNFSRPIRSEAEGGLGASASLPSLVAAREAPKPLALLQSPLLLKGESEATGFAQIAIDDEEEILADSGSEAHRLSQIAKSPARQDAATPLPAPSISIANIHKTMPQVPQQDGNVSPRQRRNSDTVLNPFAPEFGKRAPGELHAWSVCLDNGVPAIKPSPSAFHRPECPLAGKTNATWQCGCRTSISSDGKLSASSHVPVTSGQTLLTAGQMSPGRARSLSAGNVLDPIRQAQLWSEVEKSKELIRRHEEQIAGLQEQVVRISSDLVSARPSLSSRYATPDLGPSPMFGKPATRSESTDVSKPLPPIAPSPEPEVLAPPVPSKLREVQDLPTIETAGIVTEEKGASLRSLRGLFASLSRVNLVSRDEDGRGSQSMDLQKSRLRSSSSSSSLNKVFRFPWLRSSDKENVFPQPTPFPLGERKHTKAASASVSSRNKTLPHIRVRSTDDKRPLPATPTSDTTSFSKDKRYPPSSRKVPYDTLHGPAYHSSVAPRHTRDRSGSSKSSSFGAGNSIFSSSESTEHHEPSRFATFSRFGRRWDSISSRGTAPSSRNSADVSQATVGPSSSMPVLSKAGKKPVQSGASDTSSLPRSLTGDLLRNGPKLPPPRRSSLLRRSLENQPPRTPRTPLSPEFQADKDDAMAPISEQSEMGSPASARRADVEMSPASVIEASPAGPGRMSMSERYRLQGLTVPAPLALSTTLSSPLLGPTTPALGSANEASSTGKVEDAPKSPASPRSVKTPLPVTFSHGSLTVARPVQS